MRFFTSIAILLVADFETRTFINFTYFSAFFAATVTALALVDDSEDIPLWAWIVPIFMVSKPAVLAALPAMILAAFVNRSRYRIIVLLSVILSLGQLLQMFISRTDGAAPYRNSDMPFISKIMAAFEYFFGFLVGYLTGPPFQFYGFHLILIGIFLLVFFACLIAFRKSPSNSLILVGASLLFFNVLINVFAMPDLWNLDMGRLHSAPVYRHIIVGFFGCILIICGSVSSLTYNCSFGLRVRAMDWTGDFLFVSWFLSAGWLTFAGIIGREPKSPMVDSSQWQVMSNAIDAGRSPLCVPINPWFKGANWMYQRNCSLLNSPPAWDDGSIMVNGELSYQIGIPAKLLGKTLVSSSVLVKPLGYSSSFVQVLMQITLKNGKTVSFSGSNNFAGSGGLLLLIGERPISINEIANITLIFNVPAEVALSNNGSDGAPGLAWMGF